MQLHPPAFERRHQRLDFIRLTHHRVPKQETHRRADHQHHKRAQAAGVVPRFKIQIKRRRHPAKQHKNFVQVAYGNMPNVRAQQIAFIPPHHGANQRHTDSHPCQARADQLHRAALAFGKNAQPVETGAHRKQHTHPQNRRLAGDEILEPEDLFGIGQITLVSNNAPQRGSRHQHHQHSKWPPKPTQRNGTGQRQQQNDFLVAVHRT